MSEYVVPLLILILLSLALWKKVNVYDCFTRGAKEAIKLSVSVFPYISAIFVAVFLFRESGADDYLVSFLSPAFAFFGIDPSLIDLIILKPLSGNGSLAILEEIYATRGADDYISRTASVMMSCSETTFYIVAVYFSTVKVKRTRYLIPVSLTASFIGAIISCLICRLI